MHTLLILANKLVKEDREWAKSELDQEGNFGCGLLQNSGISGIALPFAGVAARWQQRDPSPLGFFSLLAELIGRVLAVHAKEAPKRHPAGGLVLTLRQAAPCHLVFP